MKFKRYMLLFLIITSCQVQNPAVSCQNCNAVPKVSTNDTRDFSDYSLLLSEISNDYRYINEELLFVYDEKYNSNKLSYKIYSKEGNVLFSNIDKPQQIEYGRNYIELDFPKSTYRNWSVLNPLLLEVTNEKNQKQYLKFIYSW